jgi:hypothetical protein
MSDEDPKRLLDESASGELRSMLRAGKSDLPDERQMAALAAKIGILGGLGGAGAAGAAGGGGIGAKAIAGGAAKVALAVKIGGAVAVVSAVGTGAVVVATRESETRAPAPVGIVATAKPTGATAKSTPPVLPHVDEAPAASASAPPKPTAKAATSAAEGPEAEVKLLERAQDALRARPAEALALSDDHARRFPRGMLAQEREVIAIEALVKSGRKADAKARAERFKKTWPGSSHTRRVETLIAD